ncbi:uncharacterized [Tachysurus ichikawai]
MDARVRGLTQAQVAQRTPSFCELKYSSALYNDSAFYFSIISYMTLDVFWLDSHLNFNLNFHSRSDHRELIAPLSKPTPIFDPISSHNNPIPPSPDHPGAKSPFGSA